MAQGGEFAFVLYGAAVAVGLLSPEENAVLVAIIIVSMALTPLMVILHDRLAPRAAPSADGLEKPDGLHGNALIIGFGRVGQIVSQPLLARGFEISDDRDRPRDDRGGGRLRLQGPLRRRDPARHPARRRRGGGRA